MSDKKMSAMAKMSVNLSSLLGRLSWMNRAGLTHAGQRDLWTVFGYDKQLRPEDLYVKYRRQDIAKPIVEAPSDALWTRPPVVEGDESFEGPWNTLVEDHQVWSVLNRADYMLGYSRFALILVGIDDGQPLDTPVRAGRHKVTFLQPYSEIGTKIIEYEVNPASPRFGLPKIYQISMAEHEQGQADRAIGAIRPDLLVHYSRVVHIADNVVEDPVFGIPRLEPVYNLLTDLLKIAGGTAETYWITSNRGMQLDIDKEMTLDPEEEAALDAEVNEYYHNLRRVIRTRGVKVNELGAKVADPSMSIGNVLSLISATTRIPQRILLGSEAGQLASEQDRANWAERVGERRNKFAEPFALLPFIARVVNMGIVPRPGALKFKWPEAFILGPLERAQTSAQMARSAANLLKVLLEKPEFISIPEARAIVGFGDETTLLDEGKIAGSGLPPT